MTRVLKKFPHRPPRPEVVGADGIHLLTRDGRRILDATAGSTSCAVLGYTHPDVTEAMKDQIDGICHIDYNTWTNPGLEELAEELTKRGVGSSRALASLRSGFVTAALAIFEVDGESFAEIRHENARLVHFATPRGLE